MKHALVSSALLSLASLSMLSCTAKPQGQVILALQTDMSLPKDIDRIRIVVSYVDTNGIVFQENYDRIVEPDNPQPIRLPATLSIVAPEEGNRPIRIRVLAFRGTMTNGNFIDPMIRVVRDAVTTVPTDRIVKLPVPIEFLCDGVSKAKTDAAGNLLRDDEGQLISESTCGDGLTCKAGKCITEEVPSADLPEYDEGEVFGGGTGDGDGTCFNTSTCFNDAIPLVVDLVAYDADNTSCRASALTGAFNVGLETQGSGMCNDKGCFVALDADSDGGWSKSADDQFVLLPAAVCEKYKKGEIIRVVSAPITQAPCAQKRTSVPTCGPWSASGSDLYEPPDPNAIQIVANGQTNPTTIALDEKNVYFTTQGELKAVGDMTTKTTLGTVNVSPKGGSTPILLDETVSYPQGLALDTKRGFVFWTEANAPSPGALRFAPFGATDATQTKPLLEGLLQPAGVAIVGSDVYVTELGGDRVSHVQTSIVNESVTKTNTAPVANLPPGISPWSVVATQEAICVAYQGDSGAANGMIGCAVKGTTSVTVDSGLKLSRSLMFQYNSEGTMVALYYAEQDANGSIKRALYDDQNSTFSAPELVVANVPDLGGLAIDTSGADPVLYYTSKTNGSVNKVVVPASLTTPLSPTPIAAEREQPGAIAVDADFVYWVELGAPGGDRNGGVVKVLKTAP